MKICSKPMFNMDRCNEQASHIVDVLWQHLRHFDAPPIDEHTILRQAETRSLAYRQGLTIGETRVAVLLALSALQTKALEELAQLHYEPEDVDEEDENEAA